MWVFDVAWGLAIFSGLRSVSERASVCSAPELFSTNLDVLLGYGGLVAATVLGLRVIVAVTHDSG